MMPGKPLMLKDYLALDIESSNAGFQCYPRLGSSGPTVRHLLDVELSGGSGALIRTRSRNTLNKISSVIKFRFFQKQEGGFLSRSLSRKLKGSFWRRRWQENVNDDCKMRFEEEMETERRSFDYPSPVVSSFRSWREMDNASELVSGSGSESPLARKEIGTVNREEKKIQEREYPMEQCLDVEKEQLSPVSVMDFPFDEEEEAEEDDVATTTMSSPPFHRSTANDTERTELHIVQKSRRLDNIEGLKPLDLEEEFNAVESRRYRLYSCDESEMAWDLLLQLSSVENSDELLLDFFMEGLSSNVLEMKLLNEARDWINNEGWRWEVQGSRGVLELWEMEKNGKWIGFEREQPEVSIDLESNILGALVQELVDDMLER